MDGPEFEKDKPCVEVTTSHDEGVHEDEPHDMGTKDPPKFVDADVVDINGGGSNDDHLSSDNRIVPTAVSNWRPFFLKRSTLLVLLMIFVLQLVVIVALYIYSELHRGILPVPEENHLLWKYGPTAFLTAVIGTWVQVEYRTKQLQPWELLMSDRASRFDSLALDYFSKSNFSALFSSIRRRHWPVVLAGLITILLQVTMVVSTGLFERRFQTVSVEIDNLVTTSSFARDTDFSWNAAQQMAMYNAFQVANATKRLNMTYPPGTTATLAYQPVHMPASVAGIDDVAGSTAQVTTTVRYFSPGAVCQPILDRVEFGFPLVPGPKSWPVEGAGGDASLLLRTNYTLRPWTRRNMAGDVVGTIWSTTSRINMTVQAKDWSGNLSIPEVLPWNATQCDMYSRVYQAGCGKDRTQNTLITDDSTYRRDCGEVVVMLVYRECRDPSHTVANFSASLVRCQPDDRHGNAMLQFQNRTESASPNVTVLSTDIAPPNATVFATDGAVPSEKPVGNSLIHMLFKGIEVQCLDSCKSVVLDFLKKATLPTATADSWLDAQQISQAVQRVYPGVAVQLFRLAYFVPSNGSTVPGRIDGGSPRLTVQSLSCLLMIMFLALTTLSCLALLTITNQQTPLPRDPATLAGIIVILSRNPRLEVIFQACRERSQLWKLDERHIRWWRPWGTTTISRLLTLGAVALAIALLQVTYTVSEMNAGITTARTDSWTHYGWNFIPTFLVFLVGRIIIGMELTFRLFQPFITLSAGGSDAVNGLFDDQIFGTVPRRLWKLIRTRQATLAFITASTLFVPFTTIVAGGLFSLSGAPSVDTNYSLLQVDGFDLSQHYNWSSKNGTYDLGPTFLFGNLLPLENFTTDTYALPRLTLAEGDRTMNTAKRILNMVVPAARGRLNCTVMDEIAAKCITESWPYPGNKSISIPCIQWNITVPPQHLRPGCGQGYRETVGWGSIDDYKLCYDPQASDHIRFITGKTGPDIFTVPTTSIGALWMPLAYQGTTDCPTILAYGRAVPGDCAATGTTFAVCNPHVEIADVNVSFTLPDFAIGAASDYVPSPPSSSASPAPPQPQPRSLDIYAAASVLNWWQHSLFDFREKDSPLYDDQNSAATMFTGPFMSITSTSTPDAISVDEFGATTPVARARVFAALEKLWARSLAHAAGDATRARPYTPPRLVNGTLFDYGRRRVVQSSVSTRILQGIYGAMLACLVIGFICSRRMDKVLPFAPSSIGAVVALLMDSTILGGTRGEGPDEWEIPLGTERLSDTELKKCAMFNKRGEYGLKWWPAVQGTTDERQGRRYGIDFEVRSA